ncbi:MAG: glycosyltransferase [Actinomycetota bacterium]
MSRDRTTSTPLVSVCVPAYRAERFLAETIASVLAQTFADWELIVLDNASPDRTGQIARSFDDPRIRVERNETTLSLPDNWNRATAMARGRYLKVLCADDLITPTCLAREVEILERRPEVAIVSSRRDFITAEGEPVLRERGLDGLLGYQPAANVVPRVVASGINPIGWPSSVLIRRADYVAVGGFDDRWLHPIDLHLWLRLLSFGGLYGIDESLASFRISAGSVTAGLSDTGAQHRSAIRTFVDESNWDVPRSALVRAGLRSRLEELRLRLLFGAANSGSARVRRLPSLVLDRSRTPAPTETTRDDDAAVGQTATVTSFGSERARATMDRRVG